jgi:linoleoyl-CoA desaturase
LRKVIFNNKQKPFYESLNASVQGYFKENHIKPTGDFRLYLKSLILLPLALGIYIWLLFFTPSAIVAISLCAVFGLTMATIGFNIMHDACHGSYSTKKWLNEMMGYTMNALGSSAYIWKIKHNIIHHTYTNVDGVDDDIAKAPLMRHCESQPKYWFQRYQHLYIIPMYSLATISWVFVADFKKYFTHRIYTTDMKNMDAREHLIFWFTKLMYVLVYMALPIYMVGFLKFLIGFFIYHAALGITLSLVFQLAHAVEPVDFVDAQSESTHLIGEEWAIHQVKTTANFAPNNKIISWFVGGLNYQIEHHLFPRVSHVHYPAISHFVREECEQRGIPYHSHSTMTKAIASHLRMMKQLGR